MDGSGLRSSHSTRKRRISKSYLSFYLARTVLRTQVSLQMNLSAAQFKITSNWSGFWTVDWLRHSAWWARLMSMRSWQHGNANKLSKGTEGKLSDMRQQLTCLKIVYCIICKTLQVPELFLMVKYSIYSSIILDILACCCWAILVF